MLQLKRSPEELVLAVLRQEDSFYEDIWKSIDYEMKQSMQILAEELNMGFSRRKLMRVYWWYVSRKMIQAADKGLDLQIIEKIVSEITKKVATKGVKLPYQRNRARRSYKRIQAWIRGPHILDLGCGDGMLAQILNSKYSVLTADVLDYREQENRYLPFLQLYQHQGIDLSDNSVDTTILWTVLHHSDNPELLLQETARITTSRIIIVEGYVEDERTRVINCFYDWYLNRPGKGENINVPFNYRSIREWTDIADSVGWKIINRHYLGVDEPVAPERHIMYILAPKQDSDTFNFMS